MVAPSLPRLMLQYLLDILRCINVLHGLLGHRLFALFVVDIQCRARQRCGVATHSALFIVLAERVALAGLLVGDRARLLRGLLLEG